MFCKFCGKEIAADSTFCKHCGGRVAEEDNGISKGESIEEEYQEPVQNDSYFSNVLHDSNDYSQSNSNQESVKRLYETTNKKRIDNTKPTKLGIAIAAFCILLLYLALASTYEDWIMIYCLSTCALPIVFTIVSFICSIVGLAKKQSIGKNITALMFSITNFIYLIGFFAIIADSPL